MLVVDTSVAVKWVVPEDEAHCEAGIDAALALLPQALFAPDCVVAEFANALFKKVRRGEVSPAQARASCAILPEIINLIGSVPLLPAALDLAMAIPHPVHDCLYLVAAEAMAIPLVTADARFRDHCAAVGKSKRIVLLNDL